LVEDIKVENFANGGVSTAVNTEEVELTIRDEACIEDCDLGAPDG
jgi:hypothetical protein